MFHPSDFDSVCNSSNYVTIFAYPGDEDTRMWYFCIPAQKCHVNVIVVVVVVVVVVIVVVVTLTRRVAF